jgi:hypothetical protein
MSTFKELYDDFTYQINLYVERVNVTEYQFMRMVTRGVQLFQAQTELAEVSELITTRVASPEGERSGSGFAFPLRNSVLRVLDAEDKDGNLLLFQDYQQFLRLREQYEGSGVIRAPQEYSYHVRRLEEWKHGDKHARVITVFGRMVWLYPFFDSDTEIRVRYIPDLQPISESATEWSPFYPLDTNFMPQFESSSITPALLPYEQAFVDYAVAMFLRGLGQANYKIFLQDFWGQVKLAKDSKPVYFKEGASAYMFAPYS